MRLRRKLLVALFIVFFVIITTECLLRLLKVVPMHVENESIYPRALGDYKPSQHFVSDYVIKHRVHINSLGLRGREMDVEKGAGVTRILLLGDSYTYGARVSDDETFPFQLERLLNNDASVEVINAGHAAYSTREEYEYFAERGIALKPDVVILAWFPNDVKDAGRAFSWRQLLKEHYKLEPWKSYSRRSAIFNVLRIYISHIFVKKKFGPYVPKEEANIFDDSESASEAILWEKCFEYIVKIKALCEERDIRFVLVGLVSFEQFGKGVNDRPQRKLNAFAAQQRIEFLDTSGAFFGYPDPRELYLPKDLHFSPAGNKLVAKRIYEFLKKKPGR